MYKEISTYHGNFLILQGVILTSLCLFKNKSCLPFLNIYMAYMDATGQFKIGQANSKIESMTF